MSEAKRAKTSELEEPAVTRFREYLRINTMQPTPDYAAATAFLKNQAEEIGLQFRTWEGVPGKTAVIMTLEGTDPSLASVILNSHIDVVPVFEDSWSYPPFAAEKVDGKIYARGSQDMKCVGMQYLEAIRRLKADGATCKRTLHCTFVPDEEIGGADGMKMLVDDDLFKSLNAGFALDEGLANPTEAYTVFYGERVPWWVRVTATGPPGHGSRFIKGTAMEKIKRVMDKFLQFRAEQEAILEGDDTKRLGDVTSVNMTMIGGGVQMNVIPEEATASFDIRITPGTDLEGFKTTLDAWTAEEGVSYELLVVSWKNPITPVDETNKWWSAFKGCADVLGLELQPEIFPAATDSRFLRCAGIPAIGFSPMNRTPILLHDHNEWLHEDTYLAGITTYSKLIPAVANVE